MLYPLDLREFFFKERAIIVVRFLTYLGFAILLLSGGCKASNSSDTPVAMASEAAILDVTSRAHVALNSGDLKALAEVIEFPLATRSHEWVNTLESYELTRPVDRVIAAQVSLLSLSNLSKVKLDSQANEGSEISYDDVRENLEGSDYDWSNLIIIIYPRGFGDVEHIVLFGVDKVSGKIKGIYYN